MDTIIKSLIIILSLFASCSKSSTGISKRYEIEEIYNDTIYYVSNADETNQLIPEIGFIEKIDSILINNRRHLTIPDTFTFNLGSHKADLFVNARVSVRIKNEKFYIFPYYVDFSPSNSELGYIGFFTLEFGTLYFRLTESSRIITLDKINSKSNKSSDVNKLVNELSEKADSLRRNPPMIN